jgi:lysophospholipase L1-like esterase
MIRLVFILLVAVSSLNVSAQAKKIVVLGSSTAFGDGASVEDSAWVNRYSVYAKELNPNNEVINLAKGGYTTFHILPTGTPTPGYPNPDENKNVTAALSYDPHAIIINLPSNDAAAQYPIEVQLANYDSIIKVTDEEDVPVWVATTQPRNMEFPEQLLLLKMRDSTYTYFGDKAIDFWTTLFDTNSIADINSEFDSGDGIHLNDKGHRLLFERVLEKNVADINSSITDIL